MYKEKEGWGGGGGERTKSSFPMKVRILTVFLLVALTLGKNGNVNTLFRDVEDNVNDWQSKWLLLGSGRRGCWFALHDLRKY